MINRREHSLKHTKYQFFGQILLSKSLVALDKRHIAYQTNFARFPLALLIERRVVRARARLPVSQGTGSIFYTAIRRLEHHGGRQIHRYLRHTTTPRRSQSNTPIHEDSNLLV